MSHSLTKRYHQFYKRCTFTMLGVEHAERTHRRFSWQNRVKSRYLQNSTHQLLGWCVWLHWQWERPWRKKWIGSGNAAIFIFTCYVVLFHFDRSQGVRHKMHVHLVGRCYVNPPPLPPWRRQINIFKNLQNTVRTTLNMTHSMGSKKI